MATSTSSVVTVPIDQVHGFEFSSSCLQSSPCQHTVRFVVNNRRHRVENVSGDEIARFRHVKKSRNCAHFNYIFEAGRDQNMQARHMNKEPVEIGRMGRPGSFLFTYPEDYKPTKMKPIKLPHSRTQKPNKKNKERETGKAYLEKHGVLWFQPVTLSEAKAIVARLRGLYAAC